MNSQFDLQEVLFIFIDTNKLLCPPCFPLDRFYLVFVYFGISTSTVLNGKQSVEKCISEENSYAFNRYRTYFYATIASAAAEHVFWKSVVQEQNVNHVIAKAQP